MPRKSKSNRGGPRSGNPATAYPNRTDLNDNKSVPAANFTGQPYGQAQAQRQAQQATPRPPSFPPPGSMGDFAGPTQRPDEPLTAGADVGPGPGSNVLPSPVSEDLIAMKQWLPTLEFAASQPSATPTFQNWVRRMRGSMPIDRGL